MKVGISIYVKMYVYIRKTMHEQGRILEGHITEVLVLLAKGIRGDFFPILASFSPVFQVFLIGASIIFTIRGF
jgi:hypothetical protein